MTYQCHGSDEYRSIIIAVNFFTFFLFENMVMFKHHAFLRDLPYVTKVITKCSLVQKRLRNTACRLCDCANSVWSRGLVRTCT